jgi:cytochrome c oxidase subunit II
VGRRSAKSGLRRAVGCAAVAGLAGSLLSAPVASAGLFFPESGGSPNADDIKTLYVLVFCIALVVWIGVEGVITWSLIKYRARRGRVAAQIHGNTRLEIGWTVGAALILVLITAVTFVKLSSIVDPPASKNDLEGNPVASAALYASTNQPAPPKGSPSLKLVVDGQQYVWRYQYPGKENVFAYTDMYVPSGVTVILDIKSDDVAHSWWIPKLGGKMDAIPGYTNHTWFRADKPGTYRGQCAELCGRNHANMLAAVHVVPPAQYQDWYRRQAAAITAAKKAQQQGAQRIQQQQKQGGTP